MKKPLPKLSVRDALPQPESMFSAKNLHVTDHH